MRTKAYFSLYNSSGSEILSHTTANWKYFNKTACFYNIFFFESFNSFYLLHEEYLQLNLCQYNEIQIAV